MQEWFQENVVGPVREIAKNHGTERSPHWNAVRKEFLEKNPTCAVCDKKRKGLNVHHIVPFHVDPSIELEEENLITLCRKHHFTFGHLGWWKSWNEKVIEDCIEWYLKYKNRPTK